MRITTGAITIAIYLAATAAALAVTVNLDVESDGKPVSEAQISFETTDGQAIETADAGSTPATEPRPEISKQSTTTVPSTSGGTAVTQPRPGVSKQSGTGQGRDEDDRVAGALLTDDGGKASGRLDDRYKGQTIVAVIRRGDNVTRRQVTLIDDVNDIRIIVPPLFASSTTIQTTTAQTTTTTPPAREVVPPARTETPFREHLQYGRTESPGQFADAPPDDVSFRGGINFGGSNISAKGDLLTTTASGNVSGSNGITDPFLGLQMTVMMHHLAMHTAAFGAVTPILHFYAAQNLGGFSNVVDANLHPNSGTDTFVRFRRGFQAGMALGVALALNQSGLCGFGSPDGCVDLTLWAGPLLAAVAARVITDETGGGGQYNSFTRNDTLFGAMLGMQLSYLACATCQLPMYLTLGGQLNFTGRPDSAGGMTAPFNFDYEGRVRSYTEAMLWVGVAFQLDQVFRAALGQRR
jgi:hypothetical protein